MYGSSKIKNREQFPPATRLPTSIFINRRDNIFQNSRTVRGGGGVRGAMGEINKIDCAYLATINTYRPRGKFYKGEYTRT